MNALHYLLQVNVYLVLFYGFYWLVLRGETFHQLNRWYLVAAAALSFFIPVWESDWVQRWFVTERVHQTIYTYYNPETIFVTTLRPEEPTFRLTWGDAFAFVYIAGVLVALGKFGYQIAHLERLLRRRKRASSRQAFSFFNHLFVGKSLDKRDTILAHERVHVRQLHSADVLLFELVLMFNWFNPVVYLYRRSVRHLHEFLADEVASRCEATKADYALLLFSQQFGVETHQLTHSFFSPSLLKRRILMLQKPRSRRVALLKYGFIAPLFAWMIVLATACSQEKTSLREVQTSTLPPPPPPPAPPDAGEIFTVVEKQADFPGGMEAMAKFLQENLHYPAAAERANVQGKVFVSFVVNRDGSVSDVQILKGMGFGLDEEAARVVKAMPKWEPGRQSGEAVRSRFNLPIQFELGDAKQKVLKSEAANPDQAGVHIVVANKFRGTFLPRKNMPLVVKGGKVYEIPQSVTSLTVTDFEFLPAEKAQAEYGTKFVLVLK